MQYAALFLILVALHVARHSIEEWLSALTMIYAAIWSAISIGIYAAVSGKFERTALGVGLSSVLLFVVYFLTYLVFVYPSFIALTIFGVRIVRDSSVTNSGLFYLSLVSLMEGCLLIAAVSILRLLRSLRLCPFA